MTMFWERVVWGDQDAILGLAIKSIQKSENFTSPTHFSKNSLLWMYQKGQATLILCRVGGGLGGEKTT